MDKIDHSSFAWRARNNSMGHLRLPGTKAEIRPDKDGLTAEERRRVDDYKDRQLYPELFEGDVF